MSITFEVTPGLEPITNNMPSSVSLVDSIKSFAGITVEAAGSNRDNLIGSFNDRYNGEQKMNGFLRAIHTSFDKHLPLILSPDDVWVAIGQGFSAHVKNHAEELRKKFVSHKGQEYIEIQRDSFIKGSPDNDWMGGFSEFSDRIGEYIGKKRDLLVSQFSTTGIIEKATSEVILMDTMKAYFTYGCRTCCGIPNITLLGTVEDWIQVRDRALALSEFNCKEWIDTLIPVLDEFIKAARGNADTSFWQSFYKVGGGSGGPYVTGSVNVFYPYVGVDSSEPNKYTANLNVRRGCLLSGTSTDKIPSGLCSVPFKWIYYTQEFPMQFIGGFVGTSQNPDTLAVQPVLGWAVADRK